MAIDQHQPNLGLEETGTNPTADAERDRVRAEYRARLAAKLEDPEFRRIEGFPIGTDEAILALSDPPYYTACPNPFVKEWFAAHGTSYDPQTDDYHREPFAADVSEGRGDPVYTAHSYHTKVPHKAIMRYVLHYTEPGALIYDGFCGTGMTGVAALMCGDRPQVESLGYRVTADGTILDERGHAFSKLGARKAILNDLSPAATFISYNYNSPVDAAEFETQAKGLLSRVERECAWIYSTPHEATDATVESLAEAVNRCQTLDELKEVCQRVLEQSGTRAGRINYVLWSDVFTCPSCGDEIVFWDAAVDIEAGAVRDLFTCPSCRAETSKRRCSRASSTAFDPALGKAITQAKQVPVLLNYTVGKRRVERRPNAFDVALTEKLAGVTLHEWFPSEEMPDGYNTEQPRRSHGITHTHHFFTPRNLWVLAVAFSEAGQIDCNALGRCVVADVMPRSSRMHKIAVTRLGGPKKGVGGATAGIVSGTLYVPSNSVEMSVVDQLRERIRAVVRACRTTRHTDRSNRIFTASTSDNAVLPPSSLDYAFTDPPFGGNLMYSELNFVLESWLRVRTNNADEAITNETQKKRLAEYQEIMTRCFFQYFRALKPGRWLTVEFHNSQNAVWNAIQEGLQRAGFVVADVRIIDKQQGTFKQVTTSGAVKQDLIISCYKPRRDFEERFQRLQGQPEGVTEFVRQHLDMLPVVPVNKAGRLEPVAERTRFVLFDRMVAYHLQQGARIPSSAAEFYKLLEEQFLERDEMYFLPDQAARYDALKARGLETEQFSLFVRDEKSAVQWVRARLTEKPQTLGDLTPAFMQELREWPAHEPRPELRDRLREYFIEDGGIWRVPDPDNELDLEALRKAALLKLFREYTAVKGPLKTFRTEAVVEGFRYCWETKQYGIVVQVCEKIPAKVLQEVHDLVQFYDIAKDLAPQRVEQLEFTWE